MFYLNRFGHFGSSSCQNASNAPHVPDASCQPSMAKLAPVGEKIYRFFSMPALEGESYSGEGRSRFPPSLNTLWIKQDKPPLYRKSDCKKNFCIAAKVLGTPWERYDLKGMECCGTAGPKLGWSSSPRRSERSNGSPSYVNSCKCMQSYNGSSLRREAKLFKKWSGWFKAGQMTILITTQHIQQAVRFLNFIFQTVHHIAEKFFFQPLQIPLVSLAV